VHDLGDKVGAYQTFEQGRSCDVSAACHWTSTWRRRPATASSTPTPIRLAVRDLRAARVADQASDGSGRRAIAVGYQSGSHYSTIQGLEQYMPIDDIKLSFADGLLFKRMEKLFDREVPACSLFSGPYYFMEQLGFRKIIDTTFMMASMITGNPDPEDVRKYFRALRRAQRDIDLRPELYTHYYRQEMPARFHDLMDTRRWGPGERLVFEPTPRRCSRSRSIGSPTATCSRRRHGVGRVREGGDLAGGGVGHRRGGVSPPRRRCACAHPPYRRGAAASRRRNGRARRPPSGLRTPAAVASGCKAA